MEEMNHEKDSVQRQNMQTDSRNDSQEDKAPYIRERIVKRRGWREYVIITLIGILIAMVMGVSVGVGVAWISPLLNQSVSKPGDPDKSQDSTEERQPSTEKDTSQSQSVPGSGESPGERPGISPGAEGQTEPEESSSQSSSGNENPGGLTEMEIQKLIEAYVSSQSAAGDMGQLQEAVKALYAQVDAYYLTVRVTTSVDSLVAEKDISGLLIEVTDNSVSLLVDADEIARSIGLAVLIEGESCNAVLNSSDSLTGLTIITADITSIKPEVLMTLKPAKLGSETPLEQGDILIAAGSPMGFAGSFQCGMMAGTTVYEDEQDMHLNILYTDMMVAQDQTSGGFLWNLSGEVVGWINSSYQSTGSYAHVLTAVDIHDVVPLLDKLEAGTGAAYLGVRGQNISAQMAEDNGLETGVYVKEVTVNSPAYAAGIQSGDIICGVDGEKIVTMPQLTAALDKHAPGDTVSVVVMRWNREGYTQIKVKIELGNRM